MKIHISNPSMITSAGNEKELLQSSIKAQRHLSRVEILKKEFMVGKINTDLAHFSAKEKDTTRTNALALSAVLPLQDQILKLALKYGKDKIGVVIGTTTSGVEENFAAFKDGIFDENKFILQRNSLFEPSKFIRDFLGLKGICYSVSSACTSGLKAVFEAVNLVKSGLCKAVVTGGVDSLNTLTLFGFDSLQILSKNPCNPFCEERDGINIGEGAAFMIVGRDEVGEVSVKSFYSNNDAYHITRPKEDAFYQSRLIRRSLEDACLSDVDYINLHATATPANDLTESKAVYNVLPDTLCSGIKPVVGHTLGAAGAVELGLCVMMCGKEGYLPVQIMQANFDKTLPKINLVKKHEKKYIKNAMSVSFAFGGDNAAMIVGV